MTRFQFVADHSDTYQVKRLCELVELERSSYYAWKAAESARTARAEADAQLADRIRVIHAEDNTYGAPRITAELNDGVAADEKINHKPVARVMRENNIVGYRRRRRVTTTGVPPSALLLGLLARAGHSVRYAPGRMVAAMSAAYTGEGKTDAKDAYVRPRPLACVGICR